MAKVSWLSLALLGLVASCSGSSGIEGRLPGGKRQVTDRVEPREQPGTGAQAAEDPCSVAMRWVEHLAKETEPIRWGKRSQARPVDPAPILSGIGSFGFRVVDVNESQDVLCDPIEIEQGLKSASGYCFSVLMHLGDVVGQVLETGPTQRKHLEVTRSGGECEVSVLPDWYRLRFLENGGRIGLVEVGYLLMQPSCPEEGPC